MTTLAQVRHTYADVKLFREYVEGSGQAPEWTQDLRVLRVLLEACTERIDDYIGRSLGVRVETHAFDIGKGRGRQTSEFGMEKAIFHPDYWPNGGGRAVEMDDWLLEATTVTSYVDTARTGNEVLAEGVGNDFFLWPYNVPRKWLLKMNEDTEKQLYGGQQTLTIDGKWGWLDVQKDSGATVSGSHNTSVTTITASDALDLSPGCTLLIGDEQMYVLAVEGDSLKVERGVNGTTAASMSGGETIYVMGYPAEATAACLDIARNRWRDRDGGATDFIGTGEGIITRPGSNEKAILRRLDKFVGKGPAGGVEF